MINNEKLKKNKLPAELSTNSNILETIVKFK